MTTIPFRTPLALALARLAMAAGFILALVGCSGSSTTDSQPPTPAFTQFVYTSDSHYGITRAAFKGGTNVDAAVVNAALVAKANALPTATFPADGGINTGKTVGTFDFFVNTGDLANRPDGTSPAGIMAATLWPQFQADYLTTLNLKTSAGSPAPVFLVPGNHDASDAIGFYKPTTPYSIDPTSYLGIYNLMMKPVTALSANAWGSTPAAAATSYAASKVLYSRDINGVHFVFINMWPDSTARAWMETDLAKIPSTTPVVLFTHDQPDIETKHLANPNGTGDINATDKFENLVADKCADQDTSGKLTVNSPSTTPQRALATFLKAHKNIVAYFHGNSNKHEAYVWKGPDSDIAVNVFRVDSPMKGDISSTDETKLSFHVVNLDNTNKSMTVREYLWNNATPWGLATTVPLTPRAN